MLDRSSVNMSETSSTIGDGKSIQHSECMDATWAATKVMQLCELIFLLILLLPVANAAAAAAHVSYLPSNLVSDIAQRDWRLFMHLS